VLPEPFAADPQRPARFQREAEFLATLNHLNIVAVYGLEKADIVLESIEGDTLADLIARSPIAVSDALPIAHHGPLEIQLADGHNLQTDVDNSSTEL